MDVVGAAEEHEKFICFQVRGQEMAVPIAGVKETIEVPRLTPLPLCPAFIAGLMNLRGDVVAVLDLGEFLLGPGPLHEPSSRMGRMGRVVLLRGPSGEGTLCGLLVDRLTAARRLPRRALHPPPPPSKDAAGLLCAVARLPPDPGQEGAQGRSLLVLDPERIVTSDKLRPFRRAQDPAP